MTRLAILILLSSSIAGCSSTADLADLKSGKYQGTVERKSVETTSRTTTMGGPSQILAEHHYYLDIRDDAGMIHRVEVRLQAYNAVVEGTRLPLDDSPSQ